MAAVQPLSQCKHWYCDELGSKTFSTFRKVLYYIVIIANNDGMLTCTFCKLKKVVVDVFFYSFSTDEHFDQIVFVLRLLGSSILFEQKVRKI